MRRLSVLTVVLSGAIVLLSGLVSGCSSVSSPAASPPAPQPAPASVPVISVSVTPNVNGAKPGGTVGFSATVTGSATTNVTWSVKEGTTGGTISSNGSYTAPSIQGVYHVVASSQADPSRSATATVVVADKLFTSISGLNYTRLLHTATLLPNGKVLIAGGGIGPDTIDGYGIVDQSELYDPATQTFSVAGQISRLSQTTTLLQNGDVLVAGGQTGWQSNAFGYPMNLEAPTAEIVYGVNAVSAPTGNLLTGRESGAASLLNDGRVLITGGVYSLPAEPFYSALAEAEVFDPASGKFTAVGSMTLARVFHTSTLLPNGKVLITGGGYPTSSNSAELYDPSTNTFTATGTMAVQRSDHTATLLPSGKVLIAGDYTSAELYDPGTGLFSVTGSMNVARSEHTATLLPNGTVLIAGGNILNGTTNTTEIYDPATGIFTPGPPLQQSRFSHTATLLPNGDVLIVGGATETNGGLFIDTLKSAEIYH